MPTAADALKAHAELLALAREHSLLSSCADLLEWDGETFMPRGGVGHRAEQLAALAGVLHEKASAPRVGRLIEKAWPLGVDRGPDSPEAANLRELKRRHERAARLPRRLIEERARVAAVAQQAWAQAREERDFAVFRPWLEKIVELVRAEAAAIAPSLDPYDALLDLYEPGMTGAEISRLIAEIGPPLRTLLAAHGPFGKRRGRSGGAGPGAGVLEREFPTDRQKLFVQAVAASLGFDLEQGRLDVGQHPACIAIGPGDTRLTARYAERQFASGFFAVLHEVGHGLYDQGMDPADAGTPMHDAPSLGMHESQARLWENLVGRSRGFWKHFFPRLRNVFHEALARTKPEAFLAAVNRVQPTLNRAEADEVTYNLHVAIRFDLERSMVRGDLAAADLPEAWRAAYAAALGIEPSDDAEGCLQDGHWAAGLFGYFPTYLLGNVYAAQIYAAAARDLGDPDAAFARGDFSVLLGWLREKVYRPGRRFSAAELLRRVTGEAPAPAAMLAALQARYRPD
ncbi:MAG: carboxypeptidase M32 [Phycisphaerales bacterium]|nr:carboxypeptidase M32 [Phycisphaerales bacterium]